MIVGSFGVESPSRRIPSSVDFDSISTSGCSPEDSCAKTVVNRIPEIFILKISIKSDGIWSLRKVLSHPYKIASRATNFMLLKVLRN